MSTLRSALLFPSDAAVTRKAESSPNQRSSHLLSYGTLLLLCGLIVAGTVAGVFAFVISPAQEPTPSPIVDPFIPSNVPSSLTSPSAPPVIQISGGLVSGAPLPRGQFRFASIPFAAPPVGPLRWLPPQPPAPWSGVRDGSQLPPYCVQVAATPTGMTGTEDCLYLNVFSPRVHANGTVDNSTLAPVMVYIHGGSSILGYSAWPVNAQEDLIASRDVVTVTVNYRVNVFGYLALEALSERQGRITGHRSSGNYGLEDNIAALQWVKENIAAFGGDPQRVTLWGQSTGGTNLMSLYISPLAKGLFHAAISLSGSPVLRGTLREAEEVNSEFIDNAQCGGMDTNATLTCILSLSASDAFMAIPSHWLNSQDGSFPNRHWPDAAVIIVDGRVVPLEINRALRTPGATVDVPLVYGHMAREIDVFPSVDLSGLQSQGDWAGWLKSTLPAWGWNITVVRAINEAYPVTEYENVQDTFDAVVNDIIRCGGVRNLRNALLGVKAPIYHFLNAHRPARPLCYLCFTGLVNWNVTRAAHMYDQLMFLRSYPTDYTPSKEDEAGTALLRTFWVDQLATKLTLNNSVWSPFGGVQGRGKAEGMYTAMIQQEGGFEMMEDLRWDKCQLLDSLGFAEFAWAN